MIDTELYQKYLKTGQIRQVDAFNDSNPYYSKIFKVFFKSKLRSLRVVDLGCGYGEFLYYLKNKGFSNAIGVELSNDLVNLAKELRVNNVFQGDIKSFLKNREAKSIDVFVAKDIFEHFDLKELVDLLKLMYEKLDNDGQIVGHVPNAEGIFGMAIRYGDLTHKNAFTQRSIEQLAKLCGFGKVKVFEDVPLSSGFKGLIRRALWFALTLLPRLLYFIETGNKKIVLSQNFTFLIEK